MTEIVLSAKSLANRLRLLQISFADGDPKQRAESVSDEIERELAGLTPEMRKPFLMALRDFFPGTTDGDGGALLAPKEEAPATPQALVERLGAMVRGLPKEDKARVMELLAKEGLAGQGVAGAFRAGDALANAMSIPEGQNFDPARMAQLADLLAAHFCWLDAKISETWNRMRSDSGQTVSRNVEDSRARMKRMKQFVQGDPEADAKGIQSSATRLAMLAATLSASMAQVAPRTHGTFSDYFDPSAILQFVKTDKKGFFKTWEVLAWEEYCERFSRFNLETELLKAAVQYVERWINVRSSITRTGDGS